MGMISSVYKLTTLTAAFALWSAETVKNPLTLSVGLTPFLMIGDMMVG